MSSGQANSVPSQSHLEAATVTPIAELGPRLTDTATRSTRGVITIVWPYSIVTKSLSFVLAEPDFRLRRQKGQVRVTFIGPSAKAVSDASLGGGDDVLLSLDGVEWAEGGAPGAPGTTLEWQARFPSGALLRADGPQLKEPKTIRVNSTSESTSDTELSLPTPPEQPIESPPIQPATPEPILPAKRLIREDLDADEYASPAFVKRARVSYGSLFEGGFNIFDEDVEPARSRKRTKFGRDSSAWRYRSQSRSPEPEEVEAEGEPSGETVKEAPPGESHESPRIPMTDEACQTSDAVPSPTPPSKRHEERLEYHEPSSATHSVAPAEEKASSPILDPDAIGDHVEADSFGGMPQDTVPDGLNQVHIAEDQHVHMEQGTLSTLQEHTIHQAGEPGIESPFGGFGGEPIPWSSSVPYSSLPPSHEFPMESFMPHQNAPLPSDLSQTFAPSFQHPMPEPQPPALGSHETAERAAKPQTRQPEPYVVSSDVESAKGDAAADAAPSADTEGKHDPTRLEENFKMLIPDQRTKDEWADALKDNSKPPGPEMTSRVDEDMDPEEAEAFPSDDGDEGGDYDTRKYRDLQDDDEGSDVYEDYNDHGENDAEFYDPDEENDEEDEEEEEEEEGEYSCADESEAENEKEEYEWEGAAEAAAPSAPAAPVFIDLISDSEDEDQGEAGSQKDEGQVIAQVGVNTHDEVDAAGEEERTREVREDGDGEEEVCSEEESEVSRGSQEGSEEEWEEDEDNLSEPQSPEQTPSSGQYNGPGDMPSYPLTAARQENKGSEDVDGVQNPKSEAAPSSPSRGEHTSPVTAQVAERRTAPTQSPETQPASETDRHGPKVEPEPFEPVGVPVTDEARDIGSQAVDRREPTPSPDTEAREPSAQRITADTDIQMAIPTEPSIPLTVLSPSDRGARERTPSPDTEAREPSTQGAPDMDVQMGSPAANPSISQPATLSSERAPASTQEAKEHDEVDVVPTEPARESLDEQVQADIERQMENSLVVEDERARESDASQQHDEATPGKGITRTSGAEALASPPLTQAAQSQADVEGATHEVTTAGGHPEVDQLPTPSATQLASTSQSFDKAFTTVEQGHSTEASRVTLEHPMMKPEVPQANTTPTRPRRDAALPSTEPSQMTERATDVVPPSSAEGFAITVKSLRSRRHRSASAEKKDAFSRDSSARLAKDSLAAREKSSAKGDLSAQPVRGSLAPRHGAPDGTPPTGRTTRSKTRSIRMSVTPEPEPRSPELGEAREPEKESQGILKLQLNKNLRLTLLDLTALKVLRSSVNRKVDVLGVTTAQPPNPQRPKRGPRDYLLHLKLADQTTAPNGVVAVQVFRPHIESLPLVKEGDALLLRKFTVTALRGQGFGLRSCDDSSWAVWERDGDGLPQIKGPPPEVSGDEASQAGLLLRWYAGLDGQAREKLGRANARIGQG